MTIAEKVRLNELFEKFDLMVKRVEELEERISKLEQKKPVGRPPRNG